MVASRHEGAGHNHYVYIELAGPSIVDVHQNFVQRWIKASKRFAEDGPWGTESETNLHFPEQVPSNAAAPSYRYSGPCIRDAILMGSRRLEEHRSI
jgi:phosphatidylserine/phosphatidylglycerophosphate/cardiolipin synthase-like enzyme